MKNLKLSLEAKINFSTGFPQVFIGEIIDIVKKKLEFSTFSTDINLRFYYSYLSSNFRGLDYSS